MNKFSLFFFFLVSLSSVKSQVVLEKSELHTFMYDGKEAFKLCCKTNENVVISIKKTNKGFQTSLQRNAIASSYQCVFSKLVEGEKVTSAEGVFGSKPCEFVINKKENTLLFGFKNEYAFTVKLTCYERKKLLKYLVTQ